MLGSSGSFKSTPEETSSLSLHMTDLEVVDSILQPGGAARKTVRSAQRKAEQKDQVEKQGGEACGKSSDSKSLTPTLPQSFVKQESHPII